MTAYRVPRAVAVLAVLATWAALAPAATGRFARVASALAPPAAAAAAGETEAAGGVAEGVPTAGANTTAAGGALQEGAPSDQTTEQEPITWPPAPARPTARDVPTLLREAAAEYGLDGGRLMRIAWCESGYNPQAVSPAGHKGVFQFSDGTWLWASRAAGYAGASPFDAEANIFSAAWLMSRPGGYAHWTCR